MVALELAALDNTIVTNSETENGNAGNGFQDLTGQKFGKLTVLGLNGVKNRRQVWDCACDCGGYIKSFTGRLINGTRTTCGCSSPIKFTTASADGHKKQEPNIVGHRFGKLVVTEDSGKRHRGFIVWNALCDCGNKVSAPTPELAYKKDCGCVDAARKEKEERYRTIKEIGNRYGKLLVVGKNNDDDDLWACRCDCGRQIEVQDKELPKVESCGCTEAGKLKAEFIGRRFGKLVAEKVKKPNSDFASALEILCRCDCGNDVLVDTDSLQRGAKLSCGCSDKENVVYVVKSEDWVKVGYSSNFRYRRVSSITMVPFDAEVLCMLAGGSTDVESEIHGALSGFHTHGEWFRYDQKLIDEIMLATDASDLLHRVSKLYGDESKCL